MTIRTPSLREVSVNAESRCLFSLLCLSAIFLGLGPRSATAQEEHDRQVEKLSAYMDKEVYVSGEEMDLALVFENQGNTQLPLAKVDYLSNEFLSWSLVHKESGSEVASQLKTTHDISSADPIYLEPGEAIERHFDLHRWFPLGLEPDIYELTLIYDCPAVRFPIQEQDLRDVRLITDSIQFTVIGPTKMQELERTFYFLAQIAPDDDLRVRACNRGLAWCSNGLYTQRFRMEIAAAQWKAGDHFEAISTYQTMIHSGPSTPSTRNHAWLNIAKIHWSLGQHTDALAALDFVDTNEAELYEVIWKNAR